MRKGFFVGKKYLGELNPASMKSFLLLSLLLTVRVTAQHPTWTPEQLKEHSLAHYDSLKVSRELLERDKSNAAVLNDPELPLAVKPFPVADYNYYVFSDEVKLTIGKKQFAGPVVGAFNNDKENEKEIVATILVCTGDSATELNTFTNSRNYPYYTGQGIIRCNNQQFDWITAQSPDGFGFVIVNMKLFDLRFGNTIFLFPQADGSFTYYQWEHELSEYDSQDALAAVLSGNMHFMEAAGE